MLKVLVINTVKAALNGINAVILNYFRYMQAQDVRMDFVFINEPYDEMKELLSSRGSKYTVIGGRMRSPISYVRRLAQVAEGYDIVHAHGNSCTLALEMYAAKKAGVPVRIAHSHNSSNRYKLAHKLMRPVFDRYVTDGFACGELAGRWLFGNRPFTVINNGISTEKYAFDADVREKCRAQLGLKDEIAIGHVGSFIPVKNNGFIIDILSRLCEQGGNYVFVSVGDGPDREKTEQKVHELGLTEKVRFVGLSSEAQKYMQAMDIFVLPSLYEGLPLTLLEAQAAGLKCIASDAVTKEVDVSGRIKYLSLEQGADEWAQVIRAVDAGCREERSSLACAMIADAGYCIEDAALELAQIYRNLVKERA